MIVEAGVAVSALLALLCSMRIIRGPRTEDRVVALDAIGTNVVALGILYGIATEKQLFVNVSLMLAITGFIATVASSMYLREGDIIE